MSDPSLDKQCEGDQSKISKRVAGNAVFQNKSASDTSWLAAAATFYYQNCAENFAGFILLQAAPLRLDEDECRKEAIFLSVVFQFPIKC